MTSFSSGQRATPLNSGKSSSVAARESDATPSMHLKYKLGDEINGGRPDWTKMNTIQWIRLEYIKPDPQNPRHQASELEMLNLVNSIRETGFRHPLQARPVDDAPNSECCVLVGGHRRLWGAKNLKLTHLPILLQPGNSDEDGRLMDLILDNSHREDFSPIDRAKAYKKLMDRTGMSASALARKLHVDPGHIATFVAFLALPEQIQPHVNSGAIPTTHATKLLKVDPADQLSVASGLIAKTVSYADLERMTGSGKAAKIRSSDATPEPANSLGAGPSRVPTTIYRTNREITVSSGATITLKAFAELDDQQIAKALREAADTIDLK